MKTWNLFLSVCWLSLFILATWCQYASWNQKLSYCNETEVYFSNYDHYPDLTTQGKNGLKGVRKSPLPLPYQRKNYPSYYRTPFWNCYMAKCHKTHVLGKNCAPWKTMMKMRGSTHTTEVVGGDWVTKLHISVGQGSSGWPNRVGPYSTSFLGLYLKQINK